MDQQSKKPAAKVHPPFRKGDRVRVRPLADIRRTLDRRGTLEALPFMPEMVPFCGMEFTVHHRLEKTCVEGYGARLLPNVVTLENIRCDGSAHAGCQRNCPILWKDAWLEAVGSGPQPSSGAHSSHGGSHAPSEPRGQSPDGVYFCQSTELGKATKYLFPLSAKRCTAEFCSKNVGFMKAFLFLWRPLVVKVKRLLFGKGAIQPVGKSRRTPQAALALIPGEWVEVKTADEIQATVDPLGRNRGLEFSPQMLPFCGGVYRVKGRVDRAILETTGRMSDLKHTVVLEGVTCDGHTVLGGCSRHVYHLWREIWLRRTDPPLGAGDPGIEA